MTGIAEGIAAGIAEGIEKGAEQTKETIARKRKERGEDEATVRKALCEDFETGEDEANRIVELVFKSQVSLRFAFTSHDHLPSMADAVERYFCSERLMILLYFPVAQLGAQLLGEAVVPCCLSLP